MGPLLRLPTAALDRRGRRRPPGRLADAQPGRADDLLGCPGSADEGLGVRRLAGRGGPRPAWPLVRAGGAPDAGQQALAVGLPVAGQVAAAESAGPDGLLPRRRA